MPALGDIVFFGTIGLALAVVVLLWKRPWLGLAAALPVVFLGWLIIAPITIAEIDADVARMNARRQRGERLTMEEELYDGTGDRVAVTSCSWMAGALGMALGSIAAYGIRRRRRKDAPKQPNGSHITDIWFFTPLPLEQIAGNLGFANVSPGAEAYWQWAMGDLAGLTMDITRTHTRPPALTETRIFRVDNRPFTPEQKMRLIESLRSFVSSTILCGQWLPRAGNEFQQFVVEQIAPTPPAPLPPAPLPPE